MEIVAFASKFAPDRPFSQVVNLYNKKDVFIISGSMLPSCRYKNRRWYLNVETLGLDLSGTRKLHD